ncbi:MAG: AarF/ABC1/UbiB kinase family protein [Lachnospiraceae bacterium]|nr:AarF/ABC1/UbiB kinase family protein [Lachnospiraceae bacterium]
MSKSDREAQPDTSGHRLREIRNVLVKNHIARGITPEKLRVILEELGPTYVKLGQIASLHSDILPKAYCDELASLNSSVAPMSFEEVLSILDDAYGKGSWQEIFASIDEKPLGSASIAQVHRARLLSGEDVIIKVERKGIYDIMSGDIRLMKKAVKFLPAVGDLKNLVDFDLVLDELWTVAQEEMDFLKEASNMEEFSRNNEKIRYVTTPRLYREYTTRQVLVMEYIDGTGINKKDELIRRGYDLDEIGTKFVTNFIQQIVDFGFFHADPHPGNVKIRDGKIVWLDMGMMGRLTEHERRCMVRGVEGIAMHDTSKVVDAVLEVGKPFGKTDQDRLFRDMRDFMQEFGSKSMGQIDVAETLEAMMEIMKANHIGMPHGLTMLARGFAHMEGVLASISPDLNMIGIAQSVVTEDFLKSTNWREEAETLGRHLYRSVRKGTDIPALTADIMKEYLAGHGRMSLRLEASEDLAQIIYSSVRNLVIGMCIVALLIASSILCLTDMNPRLFGIPALGAFGYFTAFGASLYFFVRYFIRKFINRKK